MQWLIIVVVTGQLVTDLRPRRNPIVHWSASGGIPRVSECIRVVFDASAEGSRGECQRREVYADAEDHGSVKKGSIECRPEPLPSSLCRSGR